jgi:hypothetical protein
MSPPEKAEISHETAAPPPQYAIDFSAMLVLLIIIDHFSLDLVSKMLRDPVLFVSIVLGLVAVNISTGGESLDPRGKDEGRKPD